MFWGTTAKNKILRESLFVVGFLLLLYVSLTLVSYSAADPSLTKTDEDVFIIQNKGGLVGAYLSALLLEAFGYSTYLLCLAGAMFWRQITFRLLAEKESADAVEWVLAIIGVILCVVSSAAMEHLHFSFAESSLPAGSGGFVGNILGGSMQKFFGSGGSFLLLLTIWLLSWSLALGLSWLTFLEKIGYVCEQIVVLVVRVLRKLIEAKNTQKASEPTPSAPLMPPLAAPKEPSFSILSSANKKKTKKPKQQVVARHPAPTPVAEGNGNANKPTLNLLDDAAAKNSLSQNNLQETAILIEKSLNNFNVSAKVAKYHPGPVITRYDIQPATGVKGMQVVNLSRDLARALSVSSIRVLETIPGTNYIGLEIPNATRSMVNLSEVLSSAAFQDSQVILPLALGQTAAGDAAIADLSAMPHLLVAGSTGSGKSVFINSILLSLLFSRTAEELRLILIDPKMLELATYADIPHLLAPVVTDMVHAPAALNWTVDEMERRYQLMATASVRHINTYNQAVKANKSADDGMTPMPYIVVVIDELADLMMVAGKKVEISISRLAQKARAAGIHLVLATQRPSVDVITGLIKANVPCRLSFQVASKVDSRTILDQGGAEALLGKGDMLYSPSGSGVPQRLHGAFISDDEVHRVVGHIRRNNPKTYYLTNFNELPQPATATSGAGAASDDGESDALYDEAVEFVIYSQRVSVSMVQRKLRIGYNRAARMVEQMENSGIVSSMNEMGARKVLVSKRD